MNFDFITDDAVRETAETTYKAEQTANEAKLGDAIQTKVDEAVAGLKSKNEELLGEKKTIQQRLKDVGDLDVEKAREALEFFDKNEEAQMLRDGKFDELMEKKTSSMRSDHSAKMSDLEKELATAKEEGGVFKSKFHTKMIEDSLRAQAIEAGVQPSAVDDVLRRGNRIFTLGSDGSIEARDADGKLVKTDDDIVMTPKVWIKSLKTGSAHYWPGSKGSGAHSGPGGGADDMKAALVAAAESGDQVLYRRLKAEAAKKA